MGKTCGRLLFLQSYLGAFHLDVISMIMRLVNGPTLIFFTAKNGFKGLSLVVIRHKP